jgi:translation initiation factor IF-3
MDWTGVTKGTKHMKRAQARFFHVQRHGRRTGGPAKYISQKKKEGCAEINYKDVQINEEIRDKEVRLIDGDGGQLGIVSIQEAQNLAIERKLDLVKIAPAANPPVCKILDYGKYKYELQKKEKEARKKQKIVEVKEIRLSTFIEEHDLVVKANNAVKFLKSGDKVKVSLRFKGREKDYVNVGYKVMHKFAEIAGETGSIEKKPEFEGRSMIMILTPKNDSSK